MRILSGKLVGNFEGEFELKDVFIEDHIQNHIKYNIVRIKNCNIFYVSHRLKILTGHINDYYIKCRFFDNQIFEGFASRTRNLILCKFLVTLCYIFNIIMGIIMIVALFSENVKNSGNILTRLCYLIISSLLFSFSNTSSLDYFIKRPILFKITHFTVEMLYSVLLTIWYIETFNDYNQNKFLRHYYQITLTSDFITLFAYYIVKTGDFL